jgi:hypothetical protein
MTNGGFSYLNWIVGDVLIDGKVCALFVVGHPSLVKGKFDTLTRKVRQFTVLPIYFQEDIVNIGRKRRDAIDPSACAGHSEPGRPVETYIVLRMYSPSVDSTVIH